MQEILEFFLLIFLMCFMPLLLTKFGVNLGVGIIISAITCVSFYAY